MQDDNKLSKLIYKIRIHSIFTENKTNKISMKFIKSWLIFEGKQVGKIYHVMTVEKFYNMLRYDRLGKPTSFTRDKSYDYVIGREQDYIYQIEVDGDRLSDNYKIIPRYDGHGWVSDEAEEYVKDEIKNIGKYIKSIIIIKKKPIYLNILGFINSFLIFFYL